jgi:signal transduction histidine kinase
MPALPSSQVQAERIVATSRLALVLASSLAIWLDPGESAGYSGLIYGFQLAFIVYAVIMVAFAWLSNGSRLVMFTHVVDIVAFSSIQFLTIGPSSPFFIYFVFSMFCGALRWGWRGTLVTTGVVLSAFLLLTISMALRGVEFALNPFLVRIIYLLMAAGMLAYLGRHEARLRDEIERLARWPSPINHEQSIGQIVEHAARIVGAQRAVLVWEVSEEPAISVAVWTPAGLAASTRAPDEMGRYLQDDAVGDTYVLANAIARGPGAATASAELKPDEPGPGLASAVFRTDRVSGRVIFGELGTPSAEAVPLTEVVAREIGASLDQMHVTQQLQEIAAREERLRLARDLHDGVLQSLTGIRLELRAVGQAIQTGDVSAQGRLLGLERALAIEQRELRFFIDGLKPTTPALTPSTLAERLEGLRERIALEWTTPVSIHIAPSAEPAAAAVADAVPLMVHEAVTNALKHAGASAVSVEVNSKAKRLTVQVSDDGHGFGFKGRYDHAALRASAMTPRSLFERVSALGGEMSIESSDAGSRVEIVLAL